MIFLQSTAIFLMLFGNSAFLTIIRPIMIPSDASLNLRKILAIKWALWLNYFDVMIFGINPLLYIALNRFSANCCGFLNTFNVLFNLGVFGNAFWKCSKEMRRWVQEWCLWKWFTKYNMKWLQKATKQFKQNGKQLQWNLDR